MDRLFKPWRIVGVSITESELSDSISNILHHFMVAHSQSQNTVPRCSTEKHMSCSKLLNVQYVRIIGYSPQAVFERSVVLAARWSVIWNKSVKSGAVQRELALRLHQTYSSRRGHRPQTTAAVFLLFLSHFKDRERLRAAHSFNPSNPL